MFQTGLTGLVGSLGAVSKIVLLLLLVFSVISWAVIFSKWRVFRVADREDKRFLALLVKARDLDELYRQARRIEGSPSACVFEGVMERVGSGPIEGRDGAGSGPVDRHVVERTASHLAQSQLSRLESYLPFLATTGNIAPFIGLLGTVMGSSMRFVRSVPKGCQYFCCRSRRGGGPSCDGSRSVHRHPRGDRL